MKLLIASVSVLALSLPWAATAGPNYGCDAVNFGANVLEKMPNAKNLCRGVTEKNGVVYAHYIAEVETVKDRNVTIAFLNKDEKPMSRVTFEPMDDQSLMLDKKATKYTDLRKGQKLDFWIASDRWGLFASPDGKEMKIVSVERL